MACKTVKRKIDCLSFAWQADIFPMEYCVISNYLPCFQVRVSQIHRVPYSVYFLFHSQCYIPCPSFGRLSLTTCEKSSAGSLIPVRARGTSPAESNASFSTTGDRQRKSSLIEQPPQLTQYCLMYRSDFTPNTLL